VSSDTTACMEELRHKKKNGRAPSASAWPHFLVPLPVSRRFRAFGGVAWASGTKRLRFSGGHGIIANQGKGEYRKLGIVEQDYKNKH